MGLIFNRKSSLSGKRIFSGTMYKKRIADKDISKKDIRKISGEMGFATHGARHHFKKFLMKAQGGGLDRKEFHQGMQDMIAGGYVTKKRAMRMTKEAGITRTRRDLRYYKDISEYNAMQENKTSNDSGKVAGTGQSDAAENSNNRVQNINPRKSVAADKANQKSKPTSIYDILKPKF